MVRRKLGFFTRVLDDAPAAERYAVALEQIRHAEAEGFDAVAVAQHHFDGQEGGLPSPFVLLAAAAAVTTRVRLTTGVVTLPLENPVRVAEDAAVLDALSGGRLELGLSSGGSPAAFGSFGADFARRREQFADKLTTLESALRGEDLGAGNVLYPPAGPHGGSRPLAERVWIGTFSEPWAVEAGRRGLGLMLSRTQPRPEGQRDLTLGTLQDRLVDAYLEHLPSGVEPRISVARSVFVADDRDEALRLAGVGLRRAARAIESVTGKEVSTLSARDLVAATDSAVGDPTTVLETLAADSVLTRATLLSFQVHPIDPPHPYVLRSVELVAREVAPQLGWTRAAAGSGSDGRVLTGLA